MDDNLFKKTRLKSSLRKAWQTVYQNGYSSKSKTTRDEIKEFALDADSKIDYLSRKLREGKFKFSPSTAIKIKKSNKSSEFRPIVTSPIESRIIQRSILNTLHKHSPLVPYFECNTSFGGIKKRSVRTALIEVNNAIQTGSKYFLKSDIESFFTKIPKEHVIEIITSTTADKKFISLLIGAINVELDNLAELGIDSRAFPLHEIGVAQGSCLSPLLGNILLSEFDEKMNSTDVHCFRYIDDFIILGPTLKSVNAAFRRAQRLLSEHGLEAYDNSSEGNKFGRGKIENGFTFLGADVRPGMIKPNKKSIKSFFSSIDEVFADSVAIIDNPKEIQSKHKSVIETLITVNNIVKGWGNQYSFCNDINLLGSMDAKIDKKIAQYLNAYKQQRKKHHDLGNSIMIRRLIGVHSLTDSKQDPIIT